MKTTKKAKNAVLATKILSKETSKMHAARKVEPTKRVNIAHLLTPITKTQ